MLSTDWKWANAVFAFLSLPTVSVEFGRAVWLRFYPPAFPPCPNPSFVAHLGGVLVGLTLGVVVLQNYEQRLQQQTLFWIFFCVYTLFVFCAVFWNIFAYSLLDVRLPPPPWTANYGEEIIYIISFSAELLNTWLPGHTWKQLQVSCLSLAISSSSSAI